MYIAAALRAYVGLLDQLIAYILNPHNVTRLHSASNENKVKLLNYSLTKIKSENRCFCYREVLTG